MSYFYILCSLPRFYLQTETGVKDEDAAEDENPVDMRQVYPQTVNTNNRVNYSENPKKKLLRL
jgi:hypothetical protein